MDKLNVLDRNDISEIGAIILRINMLWEFDEYNKKVIIDSDIEKKEIKIWRVVDGEYRECLRYEFVKYWDELEWLRWFYNGLLWNK